MGVSTRTARHFDAPITRTTLPISFNGVSNPALSDCGKCPYNDTLDCTGLGDSTSSVSSSSSSRSMLNMSPCSMSVRRIILARYRSYLVHESSCKFTSKFLIATLEGVPLTLALPLPLHRSRTAALVNASLDTGVESTWPNSSNPGPGVPTIDNTCEPHEFGPTCTNRN